MSTEASTDLEMSFSKSVEKDVETSSTFPAEMNRSLDFDCPRLSRFERLPTETFLNVCRFLEPGYLLRDVIVVSRHLYYRLACEATWKIRQEKIFKAKYPPVKVDEEMFPWSLSCIAREEQMRCWSPEPQRNVSSPNDQEVTTGLKGPDKRMVTILHPAGYEFLCVHLCNSGRLLITGGREILCVWNVQNCLNTTDDSQCRVIKGSPGLLNTQPESHWVIALDTNEKHIISSGFDTNIKIWDKNVDGTGGNLINIREFALETPSPCISADYQLMACGTYDKRIMLFDSRSDYANIHKFSWHPTFVSSLALDEKRNVIYSCSDDGLICLTDLRNFKEPLKRVSLGAKNRPTTISYRSCYPLCDWFYVGDRKGNLHLFDSDLELKKTYQVGHDRVISSIAQGLGSVIISSCNGILNVFEPSLNLKSVYEWSEIHGTELHHTEVTMSNNTVAVASWDGAVRLWSPNIGSLPHTGISN